MAYTTINKSSSYFNTILYTGNGSARSLTGVNFKPDFVWIKSRSSGTWWHQWQDIVRGATKRLASNDTATEATDVQTLTSFDTDGFSLGTSTSYNNNADTYVAWNWLAANSTTSNTSGTITSTVSANTTSGVSIVSYTGNGSSSATVGHGLGVTPAMIIIKNRSAASQWMVKHKSLATDYNLQLNVTDAQVYLPSGTGQGGVGNLSSSSTFGFTSGTTGVNNVNNSGSSFIAYCFAEVKGYSKFGSYTGNGNTSGNGTFVYLGFKPKFIMIKRTDTGGYGWYMRDTARDPYNVGQNYLDASSSAAEGSGAVAYLDYLSNGFKLTNTSASDGINASGGTYIYMAFAENPFVSATAIPTTAR